MRSRSRHDAEFAEFMAARADRLFRSAMMLTLRQADAEDLVQTTLVKVYASWAKVRRAEDPVAYSHGILHKTFLSERRRRSSGEVPVGEQFDQADARDPANRIALFEALGELAPLDRAVVVLRHWEDLSVVQTAEALGLSEAAVKNRSLRALRVLRARLDDPHLNGAQ